MAFDELFKFQVTIGTDSGIPRDAITNTWHFVNDSAVATDFDNVRDMLRDFYTVVPTPGSGSIASFMSKSLNGPAIVKAYNMAAPIPRAPAYESSFPITFASTSDDLPSECAIVLSFQAPRESGLPQARRRNRVYLGPFASSANSASGRPGIAARVASAARDMLEASDSSVAWRWVTYSPTTEEFHLVTNGWVDNSWDTQRRRGLAPTTRTTWTDSTP